MGATTESPFSPSRERSRRKGEKSAVIGSSEGARSGRVFLATDFRNFRSNAEVAPNFRLRAEIAEVVAKEGSLGRAQRLAASAW
jgi:hypothetical protein